MMTEKLSFKNIKDVLSRDEMKKVMAGECNVQICFNCVQTAAYITCLEGPLYSECVNNISSQCFSNFSISSTGCYC